MRLEYAQVSICPTIQRERDFFLEDDLSDELPPGLLVQDRGVDVINAERVIAFNLLPGDINVCISFINTVVALKEVKRNRLNSGSERNLQIDFGFQSQHSRIGLWVIDNGIDENNVRFIDDQLRDRGNRDKEAVKGSVQSFLNCGRIVVANRRTHKTGRKIARKITFPIQ